MNRTERLLYNANLQLLEVELARERLKFFDGLGKVARLSRWDVFCKRK